VARFDASALRRTRDSLFGSTKRVSELIHASKHVNSASSSFYSSLTKSLRIVFCRADNSSYLDDSRYQVQSVARAAHLLNEIADHGARGLSVTEISDRSASRRAQLSPSHAR